MIHSIEMTNWRAYEHKRVDFVPGITFLMGANGVGKTSILEAIMFALTGEVATVERSKLLRDPAQLATVCLTFSIEGQVYRAERSLSSRRLESAGLFLQGTRKALASSHSAVTKQIERYMGVSADFLQRIVYMAEGDVFRFLSKPPGKALDWQIRQVLGLTQMDEFARALDQAEKEIKQHITALQRILDQLGQLGVETNPEQYLREKEEQHNRILAELRSIEANVARSEVENQALDYLAAQFRQQRLFLLQEDAETWQMAQRMPLPELYEQLTQRLDQAGDEAYRHRLELARLDGEQAGFQRILDILQPYSDRAETLPCPVCRKPMTRDEREQVQQEIRDDLERVARQQRDLHALAEAAEQLRGRLMAQVEYLREPRNALIHSRIQSLSPQTTLPEILRFVQSQQAYIGEHIAAMQERASALQQQIVRLEGEKAEYIAIQRRLEGLGYNSAQEAQQGLVDLEVRSLALRAAATAVQETLTRQRNADLDAIYAQIGRVWGAFVGQENWQVHLDNRGVPVLENHEGRQFDLSQFSGGEKTALLVILHTIIAHHFSRSDFLLIDEPLEHLDPINRRSLIRFLVGGYHRGSFKQAIVATFEESLIRKYMSQDGVNVIHL